MVVWEPGSWLSSLWLANHVLVNSTFSQIAETFLKSLCFLLEVVFVCCHHLSVSYLAGYHCREVVLLLPSHTRSQISGDVINRSPQRSCAYFVYIAAFQGLQLLIIQSEGRTERELAQTC